ncbi:unnamed protein product [Paramecium sonneborni]|uniref:Cyclic nucleotide-binding domain-containing protein n=1 Tax=Paramecium sonneborni TaxID=65129 RepID=A0A8S1QD27_9CILI|nr:unnamed protein product [Paramecium sonneborni]
MNQTSNKEFINLQSSNTSRNYSHCSYKQNSKLIQQMPHNEFFMQYPFQPKDSTNYDMNGFELDNRDPQNIDSYSNRSKQCNTQNMVNLSERRRITSPTTKQRRKKTRAEEMIKKIIDKLKISSNEYTQSFCVNQLLQTGTTSIICDKQKEKRSKLKWIKESIKFPIARCSRFREIQKKIMQVSYITILIFSPLILIFPQNQEIILLMFALLILSVLNNIFNLHTTYYQNDVEITNLRQIQINYIKRYLIKDFLVFLSFIFMFQFCETDQYMTIIGVIVLNIMTIQKVKLHNPLSQSLAVLLAYRFSIGICYCHLFTLIYISLNHSQIIYDSLSVQFKIYLTYLHKYLDEYLTIYGSLTHETSFELQFAIFVQIIQTCNKVTAFLDILFFFNLNVDQYLFQKHYFDFKAFLKHHKIDGQLKKKALSNYKYEMKNDIQYQSSIIDAKSIKYVNCEVQKSIEKTINGKYFQKITIFQKFSQDTQERLVEKMQFQTYQPNEMILKQNQSDDDSLYLINKGYAKVCYTGINNAQSGIKQLSKFQTFGEVSFFTGLPRTSSVICIGQVEVYKITRNDFLNVIKNNRLDLEIASLLRDQILFGNDYGQIGLRCFCCNATNHLISSCDKLHYNPNKEKILSQCSYNHIQSRKLFKRNGKRTQNSRDYLFQIGMAGEEFQENNFIADSQILKDLTYNQNYWSSTNIQQNQSQQISYQPIMHRTKHGEKNSILLSSELDDIKESCLDIDTNLIKKEKTVYTQQNQLQMKTIIKELECEDESSLSDYTQTISQQQNIQQIQTSKVNNVQVNMAENKDKLLDIPIFGQNNNIQQLNQRNSPRNSTVYDLKNNRQNRKSFSYTPQPDISKKLENIKWLSRSNRYLDETDINQQEQIQIQQRKKSPPSYNLKQDENIFIALTNLIQQNNFSGFSEDDEFEKGQNFSKYFPFFNPDYVIKKYNNLKQQQFCFINKSKYTLSYVLSEKIKRKLGQK